MNYTKLLLGGMLLLLTAGCQDVLEEEPKNFIGFGQFFKNATDLRASADAMYKPLQDGTSNSIYGRWWPAIDLNTDDMTCITNQTLFNPWFTHTINGNHTWIAVWQQWQSMWLGVYRANVVLNRSASVPNMTQADRNAVLGEARALRALYYLHLIRTWGDVPLIMQEVESLTQIQDLPRESVEKIYDDLIIPDLKFAEENCVNTLHMGRITRWTAKIMLADVYMHRAGWRWTSQGQFQAGQAANWQLAKAQEIITGSPHGLNTARVVSGADTTPACGVAWVRPFSRESMLELASLAQASYGSWINRECLPSATGAPFWGAAAYRPFAAQGNQGTVATLKFVNTPVVGTYIPTPNLFRDFEPGDQRKSWGILTRYTGSDGKIYLIQPTFRKFVDYDFLTGKVGTSFQFANVNHILYRFADALLIGAEASNEVGGGPTPEAYTYINQIRSRAGLANLPTGLSQEAFRQAVWKERRREFFAENKRRFDLIRTKRLTTATTDIDMNWLPSDNPPHMTAAFKNGIQITPWPDREWLFPIPLFEMTINKSWVNNPGY